MTLAFHLKLAGLSLLVLAAMNIYIVKHFGWRQELARVSLLTRQIFFVHHFFIMLLLVGMGLLALCFTPAILTPTPLARLALGFLAVFWALRLVFQWFVYDRGLWRGQRFNTMVQCACTVLWAYYAAVFGFAWWRMTA